MPRCSLHSYANTGLTSAVRSKQGRGTLEPSLPPPSLTPSSDLSLSLTHAHRHRSQSHHAYLSGTIPPPHAGFYSCIRLIPTQASLREDPPTRRDCIIFASPVVWLSWAPPQRWGETSWSRGKVLRAAVCAMRLLIGTDLGLIKFMLRKFCCEMT